MMEEQQSLSVEELRIGFITIRTVAENTYRAGLLVTDAMGKPLEIRATADALHPDRVQTILYGATLGDHLVQLCGRALLEALEARPDVLLADHPSFLYLHTTELPLVFLRRSGDKLEVDHATEQALEDTIQDPSGEFYPVTVVFHESADEDLRRQIRTKLAALFQNFDLVEPFERVAKVLALLHEQASHSRV